MNLPPPPRWAQWLILNLCDPDRCDDLLGDLLEVYEWRASEQGVSRARIAFILDALRCLHPTLLRPTQPPINTVMLRNYLTIAWRNFTRQRAFSLINLLGLSVGLTCTFLIGLWVMDELGTDRFHEKGDRLYRVISHLDFGNGDVASWYTSPLALEEVIPDQVPEVRDMTFLSYNRNHLFTHEGRSFQREGTYASANFFQHFSYPLAKGDPKSALAEPNSVVISQELASSLFGNDNLSNVLGRTILVNQSTNYQITGILEPLPGNSSLQFDFVIPVKDLLTNEPYHMQWGNFNFQGFALLEPGADRIAAGEKISEIAAEKRENDAASFELQSIEEAYLYGKFENGENTGGRIEYVRIFSIAAFFILLIACINFMNLATARSTKRAREVGVRKVIGAHRSMLIGQFFGEAILMAFLAMVISVIAVEALLPGFGEIMGKDMHFPLNEPKTWLLLLGLSIGAGILAGSYPALLLSSLNIIDVLRGSNHSIGGGHLNLRRGLVSFQFVLSITLIVSSLVIVMQLDFIQNKNIGLNKDQVLTFRLPDYSTDSKKLIQQQLEAEPGVLSTTFSNMDPINIGNSTTSVSWKGKPEDREPIFHALMVDYDYVETFEIELLAGRSHQRDMASDSTGFLINEAALREAGWADPEEAIGEFYSLWGVDGTVIGVMKDFHIASMYTPIEPTIFAFYPNEANKLFIRLDANRMRESMASIEKIFHGEYPDYPFTYSFLDQEFDKMYTSETRVSKLASLAAALAIFVACLGLLGLAAFSAEQRTRELSIRKVLGASSSQLIALMGKEFTLLVVISFLIATPISFYLLRDWLGQFAYRIELGWWVFTAAGLITLIIAWLTISWQALKAARANPADALRGE